MKNTGHVGISIIKWTRYVMSSETFGTFHWFTICK